MTRRERIIQEVKAALETILIANTYFTDAGNNVFTDLNALNESGVYPMININEGQDTNAAGQHLNWTRVNLPLSIGGYLKCTPDTANNKSHELIGDIKKAIFSHVKQDPENYAEIVYQSATILEREIGSDVAVVQIEIEIIYTENLADPEN